MTRQEFDSSLRGLCARFGRSMPPSQVESWWEDMQSAPAEAFAGACRDSRRYSRTFPPLSELIERVHDNLPSADTGAHFTNAPPGTRPNPAAASLVLTLFKSAGTLEALDEIVSEWNRDHPEQRDLWEKMGMAYLRGGENAR